MSDKNYMNDELTNEICIHDIACFTKCSEPLHHYHYCMNSQFLLKPAL